jgi:hypothetical protein
LGFDANDYLKIGVHTFEDRESEEHSSMNVVREGNQSRPQGHVVEQVDEDEY